MTKDEISMKFKMGWYFNTMRFQSYEDEISNITEWIKTTSKAPLLNNDLAELKATMN